MLKSTLNIIAFALSMPALAAPSVTVSGDCPGDVTIDVTGITPGGTIGIMWGTASPGGGETIPAGPCAGVESELTTLRYLFSVTDYDGDGAISFSPTIRLVRRNIATIIKR